MDPYHLYPFKDVLQWGYVNEYTFYIIMKDNPAKKHVFGTNSGSGICDALSIYVRGIMKQMEIQNENANTKTNSPSSRVTNVDTINGG